MAEIALEFNETDLARLVLDYLEEEECTAAYNAFMKGSRHLEAHMSCQTSSFKSLRDIYAEYCTFRTYTRSGKMPALHSQLLKCKSILNTAQLFFAYIKMLQALLDQAQHSVPPTSHACKRRVCEECSDMNNIEECLCCNRLPGQHHQYPSSMKLELQKAAQMTTLRLASLVETTQLSDLPGTNAPAKRKPFMEKDCSQPLRAKVSDVDPRLCRAEGPEMGVAQQLERSQPGPQARAAGPPSAGAPSLNLSVKTSDLMNCSENLSGILGIVNRTSVSTAHTNNTTGADGNSCNASQDPAHTSSTERSFHDFVSGVGSVGVSKTAPSEAMPDSSTPESVHTLAALPCSNYECGLVQPASTSIRIVNDNCTPKLVIQPQGKVPASLRTNISGSKTYGKPSSQTICSSSSSNKIKILSDNILSGDEGKMIINKATGAMSALKPLPCKPIGVTTFTTLPSTMIQINGLAAYQKSTTSNKVYTKDQIMAMPTVFVMQSASTNQTASTGTTTVTTTAASTTVSSRIPVDSGYRSLEPISEAVPSGQLRTLETVHNFINNGEMPKETVSMEKVTTPNKPLLTKKASSTPRRTSSSHVRVLDFNTPRRILTEEMYHEDPSAGSSCPPLSSVPEEKVIPVHTVVDLSENDLEVAEQKNIIKKSKHDWDADLRALLPTPIPLPTVKKKPKKRTPKAKDKDSDTCKKTVKEKKIKPKTKKNTENLNEQKVVTPSEDVVVPMKSITVKPTINIKQSRENVKETPIKEDKCVELSIPERKTPETDNRLTVVNPPSAKHNLSDYFLGIQTPLKSILDSIQIETPRFDPSILGDPISDIKIGDIPTPNFFNTPNFGLSGGKSLGLGPGATPSSYSSRPTDYSSGGSYYRPDEQDYVPPLEDLQPPPMSVPPFSPIRTALHTSTKQQIKTKTPRNKVSTSHGATKSQTKIKTPKNKRPSESDSTSARSSRPRRRCTLKVSYNESSTLKTNNLLEHRSSTENTLESLSPSSVVISPSSSDCIDKVDTKLERIQGTVKGTSQVRESALKKKENREDQDAVLLELEAKRKRIIEGLKKRTPKKSPKKRRSGSSFPKLKIREVKSKSSKRPKTVAELKRGIISPRRMPNESIERAKTKYISRDQPECSTSAAATPARARSRRKSSTPRKVDKFVAHNLDDSVSADTITQKLEAEMTEEELPPLRVSSDDGSQDSRSRRVINYEEADTDEIHQIRAFIEKSSQTSEPTINELVQRGFDLETAKSIERDLLGTPSRDVNKSDDDMGKVIVDIRVEETSKLIVKIEQPPNNETLIKPEHVHVPHDLPKEPLDVSKVDAVDKSTSQEQSNLKNDSAHILDEDIYLSYESFNEESANYFTCVFDEQVVREQYERKTIDENYSLSVQFEDEEATNPIRVCLVKQETLFDIPPTHPCDDDNLVLENADKLSDTSSSSSSSDSDEPIEIETTETLHAVQSISNIDPLYTPIKIDCNTSVQRQCIDIFDSTLNSLDTPLKLDTPFKTSGANTPRSDVEYVESSSRFEECAKRKRESDSPVEEPSSKKSRPDRRLLQHIDIDLVLTKIHGESEKS